MPYSIWKWGVVRGVPAPGGHTVTRPAGDLVEQISRPPLTQVLRAPSQAEATVPPGLGHHLYALGWGLGWGEGVTPGSSSPLPRW